MAPKAVKKVPGAAGLATRCESVKKAIQSSTECPARVKQMLCSTLGSTVGVYKVSRHPFNERFVSMIEETLSKEGVHLEGVVSTLQTEFDELSPAKATREEALEGKKTQSAEKGAELEAAKQAVTDATAASKDAAAKLVEAQKAQVSGDEEVEGLTKKKENLAITQAEFVKLAEGTSEDKDSTIGDVMVIGSQYGFDGSLMNTAQQVLVKDSKEWGQFDETCVASLKEAFANAVAKLDGEIEAHAPAKAERAAVVAAAEAEKASAEEKLTSAKANLVACKEAKATADADQKAAAKSLADFMPELKTAGDKLDAAKQAVKAFQEGPLVHIGELKEYKEGDFVVLPYYVQKDGMKLDRAVIDACTEAVGASGRVTLEGAKTIFEKIADANKVTKAELWTYRYCNQAFNWDEEAHDWIISKIKEVPGGKTEEERAAKRAKTSAKSYYEVIDGLKCDRSLINAVRDAIVSEEGGERRVSLEDAQTVWEKAADGKGVTMCERWTLRMVLTLFNWTREGHDFINAKINELDAPAPAASS